MLLDEYENVSFFQNNTPVTSMPQIRNVTHQYSTDTVVGNVQEKCDSFVMYLHVLNRFIQFQEILRIELDVLPYSRILGFYVIPELTNIFNCTTTLGFHNKCSYAR